MIKVDANLPYSALKDLLDESVDRFNRHSFIATDPISVPHLFTKKQDIEISAFLAATIAWGQRKTLIRNANQLVTWMDMQPYEFILSCNEKELKRFEKFVHRTFNGQDCMFFMQRLKFCYQTYESLESIFKTEAGNVKDGIIHFRAKFLGEYFMQNTKRHLSDPAAGSAAKRINMFLRWMVRKDNRGVDFGIWTVFKPAQLICPLDVHSGSVARALGLLQRKQNDWKAAEELTNRLRLFDAVDPIKYDYALFGLGAFDKILKQ